MSERSRRQGAGEAPFSLPMGHPLGEVGDEWLTGTPARPREDGDRTAAAAPAGKHGTHGNHGKQKHTPSRNLAYGDYWVEKDGAEGGSGRNSERSA